jgi:hypothetical protein
VHVLERDDVLARPRAGGTSRQTHAAKGQSRGRYPRRRRRPRVAVPVEFRRARRGYLGVIEDAALRAGRKVTLLRTSGAAPDHVLNPAYAEGEYLTALLFHVA